MIRNDTWRDDRATVIPLLFVMLLALLAVTMSIYQLNYVPTQGKQAEIDAHRGMLTDVREFDFAVRKAIVADEPEPVAIGETLRYPLVFPSPPEPLNTVATTENETLTLENYQCVDGAACDGSGTAEVNSTAVVFLSDYNYFRNAQAYGYEYGVVFSAPNSTPEGNGSVVTYNDQTVIDGTDMNLILFQGNFSHHRRGAVPVTVTPNQAKSVSYRITGASGQNINITLPTEMPEEEWRNLLANQTAANGGNIEAITYKNYTMVQEDGDDPGNTNQDHWEDCDHSGEGRPFVQCTKDNSSNYVTLTLNGSKTYTVDQIIFTLNE